MLTWHFQTYLGMFFHRLYILTCRYKYTIHEYWSRWHCCHIQEKKHCIRQHLKKEHKSLNCNMGKTKGVLTGLLVRFLFGWYKEKFQTFYPPACNLIRPCFNEILWGSIQMFQQLVSNINLGCYLRQDTVVHVPEMGEVTWKFW